jgi:hypothetical protein
VTLEYPNRLVPTFRNAAAETTQRKRWATPAAALHRLQARHGSADSRRSTKLDETNEDIEPTVG